MGGLFLINEGIVVAGLAVLVGGAAELGYGLGGRERGKAEPRALLMSVLGAVLGLLALLLGFTFSMAALRFEARKQLEVDEANAIGTLFLRSGLLPEPERAAALPLVREYVEAQVTFYEAGVQPEQLAPVDARLNALQDQLWALAVAASAADPRAIPTGLFVQALNDTIDLHGKRLAAMENHVPEAALLMLCVVAMLGAGLTGFAAGTDPRSDRAMAVIVAFLIVLVIGLIVDLDRPRRGIITVGEASMLRLQQTLKTSP
ncbi:MAG: hypothetical protein JST54_32850 [Deltaproteobacteria bacterium]|nr:hypothetical protein [Deltaproteobacteria bacterium]